MKYNLNHKSIVRVCVLLKWNQMAEKYHGNITVCYVFYAMVDICKHTNFKWYPLNRCWFPLQRYGIHFKHSKYSLSIRFYCMDEQVIITKRAIEVILFSWKYIMYKCMGACIDLCRCIHKIINYWFNSIKLLFYTKKSSLFSLNWLLVLSIHFTVSHNIDSYSLELRHIVALVVFWFKIQIPSWKYRISLHFIF